MSKASQTDALRLAAAIGRAFAMHDAKTYGFGELQRFHGGPDAISALRLCRLHLPTVDAALKIYGLRVARVSRQGLDVRRT